MDSVMIHYVNLYHILNLDLKGYQVICFSNNFSIAFENILMTNETIHFVEKGREPLLYFVYVE